MIGSLRGAKEAANLNCFETQLLTRINQYISTSDEFRIHLLPSICHQRWMISRRSPSYGYSGTLYTVTAVQTLTMILKSSKTARLEATRAKRLADISEYYIEPMIPVVANTSYY